MATVPTPLAKIGRALKIALDPEYTYYKKPPKLDYETPYVRRLRIRTDEVNRPSSGRWEINMAVELEVVVDPFVEDAEDLAERVIDTLDATTWVFEGFGVARNFGSAIELDTIQGMHEEDLDRVILDYTFIVDYLT